MRQKIAAALIIIIVLLTGCGKSEPLPGEDMILAARQHYASLDSARVTIDNGKTGETEQTFTFKYDEKDVMIYSYTGDSDGVHLAQYNNGREQFTDDNGEISALTVADREFTAYSRDVKYPMADEGLILFFKAGVIPEKSYVKEAAMLDHPNALQVHHEYDVSKITSEYSGSGQLTAFSVDYFFETDGDLMYFYENTDVAENGETVSHRYMISISDENAVEKVENVVDISGINN